MPTLIEIKEYLRRRLDDVTDKAKLEEWLEALFEQELGKILGINLYIDLKTGSLDQSLIVEIIDCMPESSGDDARERFLLCLEKIDSQERFTCQHARRTQPLVGDRYVRVIRYESLFARYFRYALGLPRTAEGKRRAWELFLNEDKRKRAGMGLIKRTWRSKMLNVWVTSETHLESVRSSTTEDDLANEVRDRLGFHDLSRGEVVCVIYPSDSGEVRAYIPTTLDVHTGCCFFISLASDAETWGLTCSLIPNGATDADSVNKGLAERVHEPLHGLTNHFQCESIGRITRAPEPSWAHLYREAMQRADNV